MDKIVVIAFTQKFVIVLGNLITYAIIGRIIMSWLTMGQPGGPRGRFSQFLFDVTEPVIRLARKLPHRIAMIDFAPLIALIAVDLIVSGLVIGLSKLATL